MAKVTSFNKDNLGMVRSEIDAALSKVEEKFGIKIDIGCITYDVDGTNFKCQLTAIAGKVLTEGSADPLISDVPAQFIRDLKRYKGADAFKREVEIDGDKAIIVGLKNMFYQFKWAPGSVRASTNPGLYRIKYLHGNKLDCAVRGVKFDENFYHLHNTKGR